MSFFFLAHPVYYISQAHVTTSWLDHCITTASGRSIISDAYITDNIVL